MRHIPMHPPARPLVRLRASALADVARSLALCGSLIALCGMLLPAVASATPPTGITGTVTNASSATNPPVEDLNVCVSKKGGGSTTCTNSSAGGKYTLEVEVGEYEVRFTGSVCVSSGGNFICTQEYVEKVVSPVQVTLGNLTKVDGPLLEVDGKISGRVTAGGAPVEHIEVCAFGPGFECARTNAGGEYTIERLPPGSYTVQFRALVPSSCKGFGCQPPDYIPQYWNNALTREAASTVVVKESATTAGINAGLQAGGHISGKVTNASIYAQPVAGVEVCANSTAVNKEGQREGGGECAFTTAGGEYSIPTLASGGYEIEFTGLVCVEPGLGKVKCTHQYIGQFYQGVVPVTAPATTSQINGSLLEVSPTKPVNIAAPAITTAVYVKAGPEVLTCSAGTWANNPTSLAYRWLRSGVAIAGQTASTYTVQSADAGHGIACEVTASNAAGASAALSNTVQIPKPAHGVAVFKSVSVKGAAVSVKLLCTGAGACSGVLKLIARVTTGHGRHKKARNVTIGSASFSMALGKTLTLRSHLTGEGHKLLGQAGKRGFKVQITGSGVQTHTAVLKAASKHHH
jgi:Carboxypeptidase regulatory-like domain